MQPHVAALDIGTNSVQLLVASGTKEGRLCPIAEYFAAPRLGEGIAASGLLAPEAIQRTLDAISTLLAAGHAHQLMLEGVAAATSAVRDAGNRHEFVDAFHERFGFGARILDGPEEALCTFLGAASDAPAEVCTISLDVGGGSTEIGVGLNGDARLTESVDVGCVRLSEQFCLHEPDSARREKEAEKTVDALLAPVLARAAKAVSTDHTIQVTATGGTATTLTAAVLKLDTYDAERVHGHTTSIPELAEFRRHITDMPLEERSQLPGIPPSRAMILPAGLLILERSLRLLGTPTFRVSTRGLRHGLLIRLLSGSLAPSWQWGGRDPAATRVCVDENAPEGGHGSSRVRLRS
ncbi:MAG: Ppx/GppA family phosphatase [Lentisphaeria bacterium]|nr:Ppx/GppA family phosphatase [Lentisphaeria bacterium]